MRNWLVHECWDSPNFNERLLPVTMIVLHYTGMKTAAEAIERLCDPAASVSAHYVIDEDGRVTQLVDEDRRAWHAGQSYWRGITDVNSASVGIELVNPGHEFGYRDFPQAQIEALLPLLADIKRRHGVSRSNVVGHSDVAPARKQDPGELFPWERLARYKLALPMPRPSYKQVFDNDGAFFLALERFGYDISDGPAAVRAFERRWRPDLITGEVDGEICALLFELLLQRDLGKAR